MFLLLRDRKNGRFAAAGCPVHLANYLVFHGTHFSSAPLIAA
ncbi:Unknown protein sequence [Pseudomonas amygdali pv. morsprunorum]|nr:Unknown protein sequence [Pseudomonas amygdali pv. morsprunorum]